MIKMVQDLKPNDVIYNVKHDYICVVECVFAADRSSDLVYMIAHDQTTELGFMFRNKNTLIPVLGQSARIK